LRAPHFALFLDDLIGIAQPRVFGDDVVVVIHVGDKVGASLFHHLYALVVEEAPVFNRSNARAHGPLDAFGPVRVRGHFLAPHRRFFDNRVHLFL
jgi:hypothetical protein